MSTLPEPSFIERDRAKILAECIAFVEGATGRPLEPASIERLIIDLFVQREFEIRIAIQLASLQNLPAYAGFPMIDHLAKIGGVSRIAAKPAVTTHRWTLPSPLGLAAVVPSGSRVGSRDNRTIFTTDEDAVIPVGETFVDVATTCTLLGPVGNGYAVGQIDQVLDPFGFDVSAANIAESGGGAAAEDTGRLQARLPIAVRGSSVAGPEDAYRAVALVAHPDIIDVSVTNPSPGVARLAVLTRTGVASPTILSLVNAAASAKTVRPICDTVEVVSASPVDYSIAIQLTVSKFAGSISAVETQVAAAAAAFAAKLAARLGQSVVLSQLIASLSVSGVYRIVLTSPATDIAIGPGEWARCTGITIPSVAVSGVG